MSCQCANRTNGIPCFNVDLIAASRQVGERFFPESADSVYGLTKEEVHILMKVIAMGHPFCFGIIMNAVFSS